MKKLLIAIIISVLSINVYSQDTGDFELGGNLGVNFSNVGTQGETTDITTSFNVAASGEYYFSDRWGLKTKLIFDQKGWGNGFFIDQLGRRSTSDYKMSYLTIPIMANWHFGSNRNWYLNFGIYAGFLLDVQLTDVSTNEDLSEAFNDADFGLALGIGYKFEVSENAKLFIELDGQNGFKTISKDSNSSVLNNRSALNFGVLFSL